MTGRVVATATALVIVVAAAAPAAAGAAAPVPSREHGASTAQIVASTIARAHPGRGRRVAHVATVTSWSQHAQRLLVLDAARRRGRDYLKVLLPVRPNGASGWIPRDKALLETTPYWIELRLGARQVSVYRSGQRVRRFGAVIGAPSTPTPRGLAAIYERNAQPNPRGFIGPWSLSLTAHSNVLESFGGGPGRVAVHGREGASLRDPLGSARSHGCIRITSQAVTWLARHVDAGTPVRIRS